MVLIEVNHQEGNYKVIAEGFYSSLLIDRLNHIAQLEQEKNIQIKRTLSSKFLVCKESMVSIKQYEVNKKPFIDLIICDGIATNITKIENNKVPE